MINELLTLAPLMTLPENGVDYTVFLCIKSWLGWCVDAKGNYLCFSIIGAS